MPNWITVPPLKSQMLRHQNISQVCFQYSDLACQMVLEILILTYNVKRVKTPLNIRTTEWKCKLKKNTCSGLSSLYKEFAHAFIIAAITQRGCVCLTHVFLILAFSSWAQHAYHLISITDAIQNKVSDHLYPMMQHFCSNRNVLQDDRTTQHRSSGATKLFVELIRC